MEKLSVTEMHRSSETVELFHRVIVRVILQLEETIEPAEELSVWQQRRSKFSEQSRMNPAEERR